jgi:flagellar biosynthesis protein FlhF
MKIKSYRAPSLREALLQIKEELGEDALVLETKQIRAGGFLGVGASNLIEVRVAPNPKLEAEQRAATPKAEKGVKLSLTEDSAAAPVRAKAKGSAPASTRERADKEGQRFGTLAALAARAAAGYGRQATTKTEPRRETSTAPPRPRQVVELAETAPRIVHRRPVPKPVTNGEETVAEKPEPTPTTNRAPQRDTVNSELARLRAELREMKLALGAFTRPALQHGLKASKAAEIEAAISESPFYEIYLELTATGLAPELARQAVQNMTPPGPRELDADVYSLGLTALTRELPAWIQFANVLGPHEVAAFIGPTGVGKTTTIAKLAAHIALRARRRVELVTLDTYRIAAVHQLKTYAEIIGAGCHIANSVVELDALTRRFAGSATVLIDTTGRSPRDLADQMELADYLRGNEALSKCMVLPATTQMGDAQHALNKFALYGANRLVLTKLDETVQPGAAVSVTALAGLPLIYLCAGQRVPEDLERATPAALAARVLRPGALANAA